MNTELPTGTLTYLFTDLEGSTLLWEQHPEAMQAALARHDAILQEAVTNHQGKIVKTTGDGLHAVFVSASQGVRAALSAQEALTAEPWGTTGPLRVRMALHSGEALLRAGDYYGTALNRAARLMAIAHGGQILLSQATAALMQGNLPAGAVLLDLGDHRLRDLTTAEHIYQLSDPLLPDHFPPLRSLDTYSHNLPLQLNSFVGRERELAAVKTFLGKTRLLTLVGPGGTGKTRLMLQTAAQVLENYQDGVWLVELASLTDPSQIAPRVAETFTLVEQSRQPVLDMLTDYLRYKQVLLLLDNCEHLVATSAQLVEHLLQACPKITIMVTSREGLAINGEITYQVPSLSLPSDDQDSLADLLHSECIQLFVERAQAALPGFELTQENAPFVAQICRRLDGIPLAIELAAARIRVLTVEQIATRLQDRFRLLTGGSRTALPRQQTLRALIDWSWELLSEPERHLWRHLSVFSDGFTLEAAEAIAAEHADELSSNEPLEVLDGITQLVAKSLVLAERSPENNLRYRMLESIRQYAHERLVEAGEAAQLRDRHAEYFIQLLLDAEPHIKGSEMMLWLKRLRKEHHNLRAAIEWFVETRPLVALRAISTIDYIGGSLFSNLDIRRWLEQALDHTKQVSIRGDQALREDLAILAKAHAILAIIYFGMGDNTASRSAAEEAIKLAQQSGSKLELAFGLHALALAAAFLGDLDAALQAAKEAITLSRENGYQWELSASLASIANIYFYIDGELDRARNSAQEGLQIAQKIGNAWLIGLNARVLAIIAARQGDAHEALTRYEQSVQLFEEQENRVFVNVARSELGHFLRHQGDIPAALSIYKQTIRGWFEIGSRPAVAHQLECFAYIASAQENYQRAATLVGTAEMLRESAHALRMGEEQEEYEQEINLLRDKLSEGDFQSSLNTGRGMSIEQAIDFALS